MSLRRTIAWLVALPLTAAGTFVTHYLLPTASEPGGAHAHSAAPRGMVGFLCSLPFLLSCLALLAAIVVVRFVQTRSERLGVSVSAWPFAFLVPLGFLLHHHFEHFVGGASAPLGSLVGPELLVGLVLQLPFALLAYLIVTALLRVADRLATALATRPVPRVRLTVRVPALAVVSRPRVALLATEAAPRAPPLAV